jgi:hypothetical protein
MTLRNYCASRKQLNLCTNFIEISQMLKFYGRLFAVARRAMRQIAIPFTAWKLRGANGVAFCCAQHVYVFSCIDAQRAVASLAYCG